MRLCVSAQRDSAAKNAHVEKHLIETEAQRVLSGGIHIDVACLNHAADIARGKEFSLLGPFVLRDSALGAGGAAAYLLASKASRYFAVCGLCSVNPFNSRVCRTPHRTPHSQPHKMCHGIEVVSCVCGWFRSSLSGIFRFVICRRYQWNISAVCVTHRSVRSLLWLPTSDGAAPLNHRYRCGFNRIALAIETRTCTCKRLIFMTGLRILLNIPNWNPISCSSMVRYALTTRSRGSKAMTLFCWKRKF